MTRTNSILAGIVLAGTCAALAIADEPLGEEYYTGIAISRPHMMAEVRAAFANEPRTIGGPVYNTVDGDTLYLGAEQYTGLATSRGLEGRIKIRLWGVDSPELHQTCGPVRCGHEAAVALYRMIERDRNVSCEVKDRDRYGRIVARCSNSGGDLGARLVAAGHAIDVPHYSGGAYRDQEAAARAERLGIWATGFVEPAQWRREHKTR